jgi:hypothetical protein
LLEPIAIMATQFRTLIELPDFSVSAEVTRSVSIMSMKIFGALPKRPNASRKLTQISVKSGQIEHEPMGMNKSRYDASLSDSHTRSGAIDGN